MKDLIEARQALSTVNRKIPNLLHNLTLPTLALTCYLTDTQAEPLFPLLRVSECPTQNTEACFTWCSSYPSLQDSDNVGIVCSLSGPFGTLYSRGNSQEICRSILSPCSN